MSCPCPTTVSVRRSCTVLTTCKDRGSRGTTGPPGATGATGPFASCTYGQICNVGAQLLTACTGVLGVTGTVVTFDQPFEAGGGLGITGQSSLVIPTT
jgi:hypothetical protein